MILVYVHLNKFSKAINNNNKKKIINNGLASLSVHLLFYYTKNPHRPSIGTWNV